MAVTVLEKSSAAIGRLPRGCELCAKGQKTVLLVTGLCPCKCFYCPLSDAKMGKDVIFANEKLVEKDGDITFESQMIDSRGTGITGGDPLLVIGRTLHYIELLKNTFGEKHHIHLYTGSDDAEKIKMLADAGLDEIRFHPEPRFWSSMEGSVFHHALSTALKTDMDVGVEIPCIPDKEGDIKALISYLDGLGISFINLNELEFSEGNWQSLKERGFEVKDDISSGVAGSEKLALRILNDVERGDGIAPSGMTVHYCSSSFKDGVQLRNRIKRRANNTAKPSDLVTEDGLFLKGIIESKESEKSASLEDLNVLMALLREEFEIPREYMFPDREKRRLEVAPWILEEISPDLDYDCYIIEEYPTADRLEVERRRL